MALSRMYFARTYCPARGEVGGNSLPEGTVARKVNLGFGISRISTDGTIAALEGLNFSFGAGLRCISYGSAVVAVLMVVSGGRNGKNSRYEVHKSGLSTGGFLD